MAVRQNTRIIAVTGTKGKTSIARALHFVVNAISASPVLGVDTARIMLGKEQIADRSWSDYFGFGLTVCPGRALSYLAGRSIENPVAVLEVSVGSYFKGVGYRNHEIGIFTNVYDAHIDGCTIKNREDLARKKGKIIFDRIAQDGVAIFNADDELVVSNAVSLSKTVTRVACTLRSNKMVGFDYLVTIVDSKVVMYRGKKHVFSEDISDMLLAYEGKHEPSLYNLCFILSALWFYCKGDSTIFDRAMEALRLYIPSEEGGRMVIRTASNGAKVILDFAHEVNSIIQIADFGRKLTAKDGRVLGVVRITGSALDERIWTEAQKWTVCFDELIIYDKNSDGAVNSRPVGEVPTIISVAAAKNGVSNVVVVHRKDALKTAYKKSNRGDVIIFIVRDDGKDYQTANEVFHFEKEME